MSLVRVAACCAAVAVLGVGVGAGDARAQATKSRITILVDNSGSMVLTPEIIDFPDTCGAFNPCTTGSPPPDPDCNICVKERALLDPFCAGSGWDSICVADYTSCWQFFSGTGGCGDMDGFFTGGVATRGDGSVQNPGCDLNGDGNANDSRIFQAKQALQIVLATFGEVEFALWRFAGVQGGQSCIVPAMCPTAPGGGAPFSCIGGKCVLSASTIGGECSQFTWTGSSSSFDCDSCGADVYSCLAFGLEESRTGGTSLIDGSTVTCVPPVSSPTMTFSGPYDYGAGCDPLGGTQLVDFPPTGFDDNYNDIIAWIDHNEAVDAKEIKATGGTPIAASLVDIRSELLADALFNDLSTPCRNYSVIVLTDGGESCQTVTDAVNAAAALQNMTFTRADSSVVTLSVSVHVIGFAICPPGDPSCQTITDLDAIANAGCTPANAAAGLCRDTAFRASNQLELQAALAEIVQKSIKNELCNGLDDDCDGEVDEDYPSLGSGCTAGVGACLDTGSIVCTADQLGVECNATPGSGTPEVCNGLDDNCNGLIDDGISCTPCVPTTEVCNGLDDDCDGVPDDGLPPPFGEPCGSDVGECVPGTLQCIGGVPDCSDVGPAPEVCDLKDNNCNGLTDESDPSLGTPCDDGGTVPSDEGECRFGVTICNAAGDLECFGAVGPTAELCNGLDDDCNGTVDDPFTDLGDACDNGELGVCFFTGVTVCNASGTGTECSAPGGSPGTEVCNGLDDDCDGDVDEDPMPIVGTECSPAIGMCDPGYWECNGGMLECGMPTTGSPEVCNAEDDDCDGFVDESPIPGEGEDCTDPGFESIGDTGECEYGSTACIAGGMECVGYVGPVPEVCNGLDDDCDGEADDFAECPDPDHLCYEGTCVVPCETSEFPCPAGFTCMTFPEGRYCVPDPCAGVTCGSGERCDSTTGECVNLCDGVECRAGEECRNGFCLDCFDLPSKCMEGEVCLSDADGVGQCQDQPCDPNPCMPTEICVGDTCTTCDCGPTEACINGACVEDLCAGVTCPFEQVCNPDDGECDNPSCDGVACGSTEVCVTTSGECIPDPCLVNQCPVGEQCTVLPNGDFLCDAPPLPEGEYVTAAGGGCTAAPGADPRGGLVLLLALIGLLAAARRRERLRTPTAGRESARPEGSAQQCHCCSGSTRSSNRVMTRAAALLAAVLAAAGCNVNAFQLGAGDGDAGGSGDGGGGDGGGPGGIDAAPAIDGGPEADACLPSPEACDEADNDCDGEVDEGFNLDADPNNCGTCGNACTYDFAFGLCNAGECEQGDCFPGYIDLNGETDDGCEYFCIPTNGGVEACDGVDNDCDGMKDEDFDVDDDINNCGTCGNVCNLLHATPKCEMGMCLVDMCDTGYVDVNPTVPGCELFCTPSGAEVCDGADNDCDGMTDEGNPGGGAACGSDVGICETGTTQCMFGTLFCIDEVTEGIETCNNLDDDCDGDTDEDFNPDSNPLACGPTCAVCSFPHAIAQCTSGVCTQGPCLFGFVDLDPGVPGCETACIDTGVEACDGIDNDCDGDVDEVTLPPSFCRTAGECSGATVICAGSEGLRCNYKELVMAGADIELEADGVTLVVEESLCDDSDGDCDGGVDEPYSLKGTACSEDGNFGTTRKLGSCRGTGTLGCNTAEDGLQCNITSPGATPVSELCDNADNDCDGHTDEPFDFGGFNGVRENLVGPVNVGGTDVVMYEYEAARPDATAATGGIVEDRSCSKFNVVPWQNVSYSEAEAACEAAGMRLCEVTRNPSGTVITDEWGRFCEGASNRVYPYGNTYQPFTCNGSDYDPVAFPIGINDDVATRTGQLASCMSLEGSLDQSGNVKEWVSDPRDVSGTTVHTLRGGSFDNHSAGLTCDFDFTVATVDYRFPNVGFRCCSRSCPAGRADCGGSCRNLATSFTNCGACGNACSSGETCQNGYCCPTGTEICADQCVPAGTCP